MYTLPETLEHCNHLNYQEVPSKLLEITDTRVRFVTIWYAEKSSSTRSELSNFFSSVSFDNPHRFQQSYLAPVIKISYIYRALRIGRLLQERGKSCIASLRDVK